MLMNQIFLVLSCSNSLASVLDIFFQMNFCLWTKITHLSDCKNFKCFYFTISAENNFTICSEYHYSNLNVEIIQIILSWAWLYDLECCNEKITFYLSLDLFLNSDKCISNLCSDLLRVEHGWAVKMTLICQMQVNYLFSCDSADLPG